MKAQNGLIDLLNNRNGFLDPFLKNLVRNAPTVSVYLPEIRDGLPDSRFLKVSDVPPKIFSMLRGEIEGKSVSEVFNPLMIQNIHSNTDAGEKLMLDMERDVVPWKLARGISSQRVRSTHMYVQFED